MPSFFFGELQLITVLLYSRSLYELRSTGFISLKLCVGISYFRFGLVFIKVCSAKSMALTITL